VLVAAFASPRRDKPNCNTIAGRIGGRGFRRWGKGTESDMAESASDCGLGSVDILAQPVSACLVRPIPEVLPVAGLTLRTVVNRRHDRLHQDVAARHGYADMFGPSAEVPHFPERSHELGWIGCRVVPERIGHEPIKGDIDIVRGENGAGKSAIYSLLMTKADSLFDQGILLVAAENPRGATVFKDLVADPPTTENEFIALWKLYALTIIAQQLREYDIRGAKAEKIYSALEGAKLLEKEFSLRGVLRSVHEYARRIVAAEQIEGGLTIDPATQMPTGITGKIVLKEPSSDWKANGFASIDNLFLIRTTLQSKTIVRFSPSIFLVVILRMASTLLGSLREKYSRRSFSNAAMI
jgi:hypothetical protein